MELPKHTIVENIGLDDSLKNLIVTFSDGQTMSFAVSDLLNQTRCENCPLPDDETLDEDTIYRCTCFRIYKGAKQLNLKDSLYEIFIYAINSEDNDNFHEMEKGCIMSTDHKHGTVKVDGNIDVNYVVDILIKVFNNFKA